MEQLKYFCIIIWLLLLLLIDGNFYFVLWSDDDDNIQFSSLSLFSTAVELVQPVRR